MPFEVRVDCPACRVEGARVETWETEAPTSRLGVPSAERCRLCGHAAEGRVTPADRQAPGEGCPGCGSTLDDASLAAHRCPFCGASAAVVETAPARIPGNVDELERALAGWAVEEALATPGEIVEGYFVLTTPAELLAALARGEAVETTFDVVDYLFSGHGQGGAPATKPAIDGAPPDAPPAPPAPITTGAPFPSRDERSPPVSIRMGSPAGWSGSGPASVRRVGGLRDELLALASVAASDGEASEDDLAVLAQAAANRGIPPLTLDEIRVRRPGEIDAPPTLVQREKVLEEMFQIAWSDDELDESEVRVVRDFARAWGVDPQRVTEWTAIATSRGSSRIARWIDRVGYFLFPGW
jgi:hypothetical protein